MTNKSSGVKNTANNLQPRPLKENRHSAMPSGYSDSLPPGASAEPGSELARIKKHNPTLWAKITNWD